MSEYTFIVGPLTDATLVLLDIGVLIQDPDGVAVYQKEIDAAATVTTVVPTFALKETVGTQYIYELVFTPTEDGDYYVRVNLPDGAVSSSILTISDVTTYLGAIAASYTSGQLLAAVNGAVAAIKSYCGRELEATDYRIWLQGRGDKESLTLPQAPIINIRRVCTDTEECVRIVNTSADCAGFSVSVSGGDLILMVNGGANAGIDSLTLSTYTTMAGLVVAIDALGSGWDATVLEEGDPQDIRPMSFGVKGSSTEGITLEQPVDDGVVFIPDLKAGVLKGVWPRYPSSIFVNYRAGYETIPADLNMVATRLASDILLSIGKQSDLQSEKIGDYSYTRNNNISGLVASYDSELSAYKDYRV